MPEETKYIIITGNPVDGLRFIGPFTTGVEAAEFVCADPYLDDHEWWIAKIESPEESK